MTLQDHVDSWLSIQVWMSIWKLYDMQFNVMRLVDWTCFSELQFFHVGANQRSSHSVRRSSWVQKLVNAACIVIHMKLLMEGWFSFYWKLSKFNRSDVDTYVAVETKVMGVEGYTCDKRWLLSKIPTMIIVQDVHMTKDECLQNSKSFYISNLQYILLQKGSCRQQKGDLRYVRKQCCCKMNRSIAKI
jgi:hypothetical protein